METESFTLFDENLTEWMERQFAARSIGSSNASASSSAYTTPQSNANTTPHSTERNGDRLMDTSVSVDVHASTQQPEPAYPPTQHQQSLAQHPQSLAQHQTQSLAHTQSLELAQSPPAIPYSMDRQHAPAKAKAKPPTPINMNRLLLAEKEAEIHAKRTRLGALAPPQAPRPTKIKYAAKYDTERYYVDALLEWAKNDLSCINKLLDHKSY
jgi:hypothetical protein